MEREGEQEGASRSTCRQEAGSPSGSPWEREDLGDWANPSTPTTQPLKETDSCSLLSSRCSGFYVTTCKFNDIFPRGLGRRGTLQSRVLSVAVSTHQVGRAHLCSTL